jgi:hypothetical protein
MTAVQPACQWRVYWARTVFSLFRRDLFWPLPGSFCAISIQFKASTQAFNHFLIPSSRDWTRLLDSEEFCSKLPAGKCGSEGTRCDHAIQDRSQ